MPKFNPLPAPAFWVALACTLLPWPAGAGEPAGGPAPTPYLAAEHAPPPGRLPDLASPLAYRLDLEMDPRRDGFSGSAAIDIDLARSSDVLWLHGRELRVAQVVAQLPAGESVSGRWRQVLDSGVAEVRFEQPLPAGRLTLNIAYAADYDRNLAGLFKVEEQGDAYVLAKSESIQARRFLPGFDEPGLKATYDLTLTVPSGYQVITNTPEVQRSPAGEGMERLRFARSRPMSTYLLSLAVGPFDVVERPPLPANEFRPDPIPLRGFARRGRGADMNYILDITPRMMEVFERELQRPYPYAKLDIVAAPQWPSGATELSAAITYRESRILVGDDPAPGARLALVNVHAHEIAHMWFGNLVTPPWWDDLWLKEGFATWGTPLALTIMEPDGGHEITAAARAIGAMALDSLASTRAIREPIDDNNKVRNAYDAITYQKSLGVISMVDSYFGPEVFRPALGRYIAAFADGEADSPQFYEVIGRETDTPALTGTFRSFVEQKGVPLVTARLSCGDAPAVQLNQQRYRPAGSSIPANATRWNIPLCLRTDDGQRHCAMLEKPTQTLALGEAGCPDWIMPNAEGAGYFRWQLDPPQLEALLADFDRLTPGEALSAVDSVMAGFEAGLLPPARVWQVVQASSRSPVRQVVSAPLERLRRYRGQLPEGSARTDFEQRLQALYGPVLAALADSDDPDQRLLRAGLTGFLALVAQSPRERAQLRDAAVAFTGFGRERDPQALDSDLYLAALTVALQELGGGFLDHLVAVRPELDDPRFASASASALGRTGSLELLPRVHALVEGGQLDSRETFAMLREATSDERTRAANWAWIDANFEQVITRIPAQWRRQTPVFAAAFCDAGGLASLRKLYAQQGDLAPGHQRYLDQTAEKIQLCMAQRDLWEEGGSQSLRR